VRKNRDCAEPAKIKKAPAPLPIERGLAGPGLIDSIVRRFNDHQLLHRLSRSTHARFDSQAMNGVRPLDTSAGVLYCSFMSARGFGCRCLIFVEA
jgi:hypothetical protein